MSLNIATKAELKASTKKLPADGNQTGMWNILLEPILVPAV